MGFIGKPGKIIFSRFLEGEDLADSVRRQAEQNELKGGCFSVIGSLKRATLGYYKDREYTTIIFEGPLEIASCTGNIVLDEKDEIVVHAHIVVSDKECKTFGGHLMKGSEIGATAESVMFEAEGINIHKAYDEKTNLKLWRLS